MQHSASSSPQPFYHGKPYYEPILASQGDVDPHRYRSSSPRTRLFEEKAQPVPRPRQRVDSRGHRTRPHSMHGCPAYSRKPEKHTHPSTTFTPMPVPTTHAYPPAPPPPPTSYDYYASPEPISSPLANQYPDTCVAPVRTAPIIPMPAPRPPRHYGRVEGPVGPPEYRQMHCFFDHPRGGVMENGMQYEYSAMTGRRKALLIGINYPGTSAELKGCWNDVANIRNFLIESGFPAKNMVVLTDQTKNPGARPTRANITAAMHWLVKNARPGDSLFFHYSGHGAQAKATQGDEVDGYNECIVPEDYLKKNLMEDDELHAIMVRPLPIGCRLTALFDSCHSGTALDLPYVYAASGKILDADVAATVGSGLNMALKAFARGNIMDVAQDVISTMESAQQAQRAQEITMRTRSSGADVVMFSGCKDSQTSADTMEASKATGALSWAWISVFNRWPNMTYLQLLNALRDELVQKYSQKPQLSSSHPLDLNVLFTI